MLSHNKAEFFTHRLKGVAEHAVADIMKKRCRQSNVGLMVTLLVTAVPNVTFNDFHQGARDMKHAEAVCKSSVSGAGENEFGKPELTDSAKALKGRSLDHLPKRVLELISPKFDQIVNWIANALYFNGQWRSLPGVKVKPDVRLGSLSNRLGSQRDHCQGTMSHTLPKERPARPSLTDGASEGRAYSGV
jgi:hypothetical protein